MSKTLDTVDKMVLGLAVICAATVVGMVADYWPIVCLAIPALSIILIYMGTMRRDVRWDAASVAAVTAYSAVLLAMFVWAMVAITTDTVLWGLHHGMAVFVYFIWPFTTVFSGALYAFVFSRSLRQDIRRDIRRDVRQDVR